MVLVVVTMLADLELLLIAVFCTAEDLLPTRRRTPDEGSPMRRSSHFAWLKRCLAWRRIDVLALAARERSR